MQWLAFLRRWWLWRSPPQRSDLYFILYTRVNCPLCDEAHTLLETFRTRYGFVLETKDVDESEELQRAHGQCVPVVTINGRLRFRGHVNAVLLQRILDSKERVPDPP